MDGFRSFRFFTRGLTQLGLTVVWTHAMTASLAVMLVPTPAVEAAESTHQRLRLPQILNWKEIDNQFDYTKFSRKCCQRRGPVKVAILDNGFLTYEQELGHTIPANTVYHEGPDTGEDSTEWHGTLVAQLVSHVVQKTVGLDRMELHLFNTYGFPRFKAAVDEVIKEKFDIVIHAQVFEFGSNGDGHGFVNAVVNEAAHHGIIWINAVGDFNGLMYIGRYNKKENSSWIHLPGPRESVRIRCVSVPEPTLNTSESRASKHTTALKKAKTCPLSLILTWDKVPNKTEVGTKNDLDLYLYDQNEKLIASSTLKQKETGADFEKNQSYYPREEIELSLKPGEYHARVLWRGGSFSHSDVFWLTAWGNGIVMIDNTPGDSVLSPADNQFVLAVGASDAPPSGVSERLHRPHLKLMSRLVWPHHQFPSASSIATGLAGGAAVAALAIGTPENVEAVYLEIKKSLRKNSRDRQTL
ncbi:MAG: hypothetical protein C5B49_09750 [Bdellovibrio sp.]|nr:MAG: hypothetical protein C5B49_09750 [Bdellovibrio sp.]